MHAAPAVGVRCAGGAPWRALQALLPGIASAASVGWLVLTATTAGGVAAALAAACCGAPVAALCWRRAAPVPVDLRWDGATWTADGTAGALDVMIDLGSWLLLRLRPVAPGRARWIAVTAAEAAGAWPALRAAAYARAARPVPAAPTASR